MRLNETTRIRWDLFVMVLATWNCFAIPLEIAFEPAMSKGAGWLVINSVTDVLFLVDIVLTFRTTYINTATGDEITEPLKIAMQYLSGRFWIDLLATIPFDQVAVRRACVTRAGQRELPAAVRAAEGDPRDSAVAHHQLHQRARQREDGRRALRMTGGRR